MALTYSNPGELGTEAPDFVLPGVDGKVYQLSDFKDAKALVVVFMCNHCPYVKAVQGRINQLAREYLPRGVRLIGINSNDADRYPDDNFEAMKVQAKEKSYSFPYLWDESQEVARSFGAVCTPEFYVYSESLGKQILCYKGRLDDNWKEEEKVTSRDLAAALNAILTGNSPSPDQKPSMGCSIKWK
jgi:peroxiredoxin